MLTKSIFFICLISVLMISPLGAQERYDRDQRGQAIDISHGRVIDIELVELKSAAAKGATYGGLIGAAAGHHHGHDTIEGALAGAALGALIGHMTTRHQKAFAYYVQTGPDHQLKVISEQDNLRIGDCVSIEQTHDKTNLRPVSPAICDEQYRTYLNHPERKAKSYEDADECMQAKQQLIDADNEADIKNIAYKVQVLCGH